MKSIYTIYKERLIEISGKNRSLYLKNFNKKNGYDIGKILYEDNDKANELLDLLWSGKSLPFEIVGKETKEAILKAHNFKVETTDTDIKENEKARQRYERHKREQSNKIIMQEVQNLRILKREIEEIEKDTGRYELFLCYPFVYGATRNYLIKAPLLLFPITVDVIDDTKANISLKYGEQIQLNKTLMLALADSKRLDLSEMDMEFDSLSRFGNVEGLLSYLKKFGIKLALSPRKNIFPFSRYPDPTSRDELEIKNVCLLSRNSLANSIYADYSALEKKNLTNDSINELLNTKTAQSKKAKNNNLYLINNVDYAQQQVIKQVNESGNMVIYGPPGTGKSQTIVNVISDAISKGKKVLVVSQKKAALEVIYNRLSTLNEKAIFITDAEKERRAFYSRCQNAHDRVSASKINPNLYKEYDEIQKQLSTEVANLEALSNVLTQKTPFGISLQEMYYNSYKIGKKTIEYDIYEQMKEDKKLMALTYDELVSALSLLQEKNKAELYYNFVEDKKKNLFIDHLKDDLSVHIVLEAQTKLKHLSGARQVLFDVAKYKYSRQVLTYLDEVSNKKNTKPLIRVINKFEHKKVAKFLGMSHIFFPAYPFAKALSNKKEKTIKLELNKTISAINEYIKDYEFLKNVLTHDGYLMALDGILNGNNGIIRLLLAAMENYVELRDVNSTLKNLQEEQKIVLNFAYKNTNTYNRYKLVLNKILPIRIYHEIVKYETSEQDTLSSIVDFENLRARIITLQSAAKDISKQIAEQSFNEDYQKLLTKNNTCKDYIYQITKKQNFWPIRKCIEVYQKYIFKLFPCWLLSPENVSNILPLEKDLFDIVLFDEASQVFIENTLPSIYRGNRIVVAGDAKQLRPTTTFMKRYMGANVDDNLDYSTQAALEVESLLDLAVSRFNSANITYHYRSQNEELIDFSNKAFYNNTLQIAPNISKNNKQKPIERLLVNGKWMDRKNPIEAQKVVDLVKQLLKTRKNNETIGIITFNVEQEGCIEDIIDKECFKDEEFRNLFLKESNRIENGEDVSLFVKNLENVQGDERDIIIFSIGYARNEIGKVNSSFGSLSNEGGENRLNVAITRAKKKIYVVTSIEPEELKIENSKFMGPKLLRSYLTYVRAVSNGNHEEMRTILNSYAEDTVSKPRLSEMLPIENQIANRLAKLGYNTEINLGNSSSKISVAVYDKKRDKYLLGIETDQTVINSSPSALERDVFRNTFLKSRGWRIVRVWSRDWWHNENQVVSTLAKEIEKQIKLLQKEAETKKLSKQTKTQTKKTKA